MAVFELLKLSKLILRKIYVAEKCLNFHTVSWQHCKLAHPLFQKSFGINEVALPDL